MRKTVRSEASACTGCGACVSVCPRGAIAMKPDGEGFMYPAVDGTLCVECDLCEKRCPAGKAHKTGNPGAFGVKNTQEDVRAASSSGGVFSALAGAVLARGGAVFGAVFGDGFSVEHVGAVTKDGLLPMRGSKYVQSDAAAALSDACSLQAREIPVLFSGTPCQVAGLYALLDGRRPENLLTVDFVCHGVPSPGVFASYLQWLRHEHGDEIVSYTFRDKRLGWKNFSAAARFAGGAEHTGTQTEDPFLRGFLQNLYLRPSCHSCTALRYGEHAADLTIADLWGAQELFPEWDDDRGLSLVFANTKKGREALDACPELERRVIADAGRMARANPSIFAPAPAHAHRRRFFKAFRRKGFSDRLIESCLRESRAEKALSRLRHAPAGILRRVKRLTGR